MPQLRSHSGSNNLNIVQNISLNIGVALMIDLSLKETSESSMHF